VFLRIQQRGTAFRAENGKISEQFENGQEYFYVYCRCREAVKLRRLLCHRTAWYGPAGMVMFTKGMRGEERTRKRKEIYEGEEENQKRREEKIMWKMKTIEKGKDEGQKYKNKREEEE
jgi:hypothetical protein